MKASHLALAEALTKAKAPAAGVTMGNKPFTAVWGTCVALAGANPPSTCTVTLAGSSTNITGVAFLTSCIPHPGDTVLIGMIGSDLVVLGSLGGEKWKGHYHANGATTLTNNAFTKLTFTQKDSDPASLFNTSTSQLTIPAGGTGFWRLKARAESPNFNAGSITTIAVFVNGTAYDRGDYSGDGTGSNANNGVFGAWEIPLSAGDVVDFRMYQNTGGNINTAVTSSDYQWCSFAMASRGI
jgi:hypothetical protein